MIILKWLEVIFASENKIENTAMIKKKTRGKEILVGVKSLTLFSAVNTINNEPHKNAGEKGKNDNPGITILEKTIRRDTKIS
jgi:hypothetical protein